MIQSLVKLVNKGRRAYSLMHTPSGRNRLLRELDHIMRRRNMFSAPLSLHLEVTNKCNLSCRTCGRNYWDKTLNPLGNMTIETVKALDPFLRRAEEVNIWGYGESLVSPNFFEIMDHVNEYGCDTILYTNGTTLNEDNSRKLIAGGLSQLVVSLDGASEQALKDTRSGASLGAVIENIRRLNELKREAQTSHPIVAASYVASRSTISELPDLIRLAHSLDMWRVAVTVAHIYHSSMLEDSVLHDLPATTRIFREAERIGQDLGVESQMPDFDREDCSMPFNMVFVKWNGDVFGCCACGYHSVPRGQIMLGNALETPVESLWNSRYMKDVRGGLLGAGPLDVICQRCPFYKLTLDNLKKFPTVPPTGP